MTRAQTILMELTDFYWLELDLCGLLVKGWPGIVPCLRNKWNDGQIFSFKLFCEGTCVRVALALDVVQLGYTQWAMTKAH